MGWGVYDYPEPRNEERPLPECPCCGWEARLFYLNQADEIIGCNNCVTEVNSYEME